MNLTQLKKEQKATIIKINATKVLKERLTSFGIIKGEEIIIKRCSLAKQTIEIEVGSTLIALRAQEAELIEVHKIAE